MSPTTPPPELRHAPTFTAVRDQLSRSPALALVTAIAAGFVVGILLRCFERDRTKKES